MSKIPKPSASHYLALQVFPSFLVHLVLPWVRANHVLLYHLGLLHLLEVQGILEVPEDLQVPVLQACQRHQVPLE